MLNNMSIHSMRLTSLLLLVCCLLWVLTVRCTVGADSSAPVTIKKGFKASPLRSDAKFELLLADDAGAFAFGFFHIGSAKLDLAVVHLASMQPVWRANPLNLPSWGNSTTFSFDGNLVLTDETVQAGIIWTSKSAGGDYVTLTNNSNLQIFASSKSNSEDLAIWQSFDYPFDTLVQGQKFSSATTASLVTADRRYAFRIGITYLALFMEFEAGQELNYWKYTPLKANTLKDIYAQVDPRGFLGIYYVRDDMAVDRIPFDSFEHGLLGFHRLTLQSDGNLYAYYWDNDKWALVYTAQTVPCGLPGICGSYGVCIPGSPHQCSCLVNGTDGCLQTDTGDFCGQNSGFRVVRTGGITVEYTDIMETIAVDSLKECEKTCEQNCVCWGALYSDTAKSCYIMDYPIQTVERSGSSYKGYFKLRSVDDQGPAVGGSKHRSKQGSRGVIALAVILTLVFVGMAAYGGYWWWDKKHNSLPVIQLGGAPKHEKLAEPDHHKDQVTELKGDQF